MKYGRRLARVEVRGLGHGYEIRNQLTRRVRAGRTPVTYSWDRDYIYFDDDMTVAVCRDCDEIAKRLARAQSC